jgi:hypothetical protein
MRPLATTWKPSAAGALRPSVRLRPCRTAALRDLALLAVLLAAAWAALDGAWPVTGYRTQIPSLLLAQLLVGGRLFLRLALMGGQVAVYRRSA